MTQQQISPEFNFNLHEVDVLGSKMAYVDTGGPSSETVVFLHGNPMSSYLWRNVIPSVVTTHRCVAPDLIGMGRSSKPDIDYRFEDHKRYLWAFLDAIIPEGTVILVLHDWGSGLGLDWARQHSQRVTGLALMEFIVPIPSWDDVPPISRGMFQAFRTPETGRKLLIDENAFIEIVVPMGVARALSGEEMDHIRQPFQSPKSREPIFRWPNELPIAGSPADVFEIAEKYHKWLLSSKVPKLLFWATPGAFISESAAAWYGEKLQNTKSIGIGPGVHWLQEDNPHLIGSSIAEWLPTLKTP